jgi:hypothetical protein
MFNVGIIIITIKFLFIRSNLFSLKIVILIFWKSFLLFTFFWSLHYFSIFFPTKIAKLRKFETKKYVGCMGGGEYPTI